MRNLILPFLVFAAMSCQVSPEPIRYGKDMCHSCKMTIVDPQHAAELVTSKGKSLKFDAIECMVRFHEQEDGASYAFQLVTDFQDPGALMDAASAHYLISPEIPSPMGAFLSAFSDVKSATAMQREKGGKVYAWQELLNLQQQTGLHPQKTLMP